MDPRLEVLTRPRDGASATVEEEHGATTVTLSWADGAELQAVQYRENDVIHAYLHGCGMGHHWASAAHVEIFLETLASHPRAVGALASPLGSGSPTTNGGSEAASSSKVACRMHRSRHCRVVDPPPRGSPSSTMAGSSPIPPPAQP